MRILEYDQQSYWPNINEFQKLRQHFDDVLVPQINSLIGSYGRPNSDRLNNFLFGVYLHNHCSDNQIVGHRHSPDPDDIRNWSLNFTGVQRRINVTNESFPKTDVIFNIPFLFVNGSENNFSFSIDGKDYQIPYSVMSLLLGIEEANHALIYQLSNQGIIPRPKNFETLDTIERESAQKDYMIRYYANLGMEFEASKAKAAVCQKYFPEHWQQSFSYLNDSIVRRRSAPFN